MARRILALHLSAILLISCLGIPVFTHVCHTQDKSWSSVFVPAKSCCSKKKDPASKSCHEAIKSEPGFSKRPCCENFNKLLQQDCDYIQTIVVQGNPAVDLHTQVMDLYSLSWDQPVYNSSLPLTAHGPPKALYGRSLLISEQLLRC